MSQCLRCKGPCDAAAVFCNECRATLRTSFRSASSLHAFSEKDTSLPAHGTRGISAVVQDLGKVDELADEQAAEQSEQSSIEQKTRPQRATKAPDTPHPPVLESYADSSGQAFSLLNEAARRIARDDSGNATLNRRLPRASRLAPFRDISAEIRRESTPLPKYTRQHNGTSSQEIEVPDTERNGHRPSSQRDSAEQEIQNASWPDFWPWFEGESEEKEGEDNWANRTDPLITRHRPNSVEAALIEQEDIRRALAEGIQTSQLPVRQAPRHISPLRNIFIALAIFAIVALAIDGVLLGAVSGRPHSSAVAHTSLLPASVTLSPNVVDVGKASQPVQVHLLNFAPNARVWLTHDIQEDVQLQSVSEQATIPVGAGGSTSVTIIVSSQWGPGYHLVVAEDVKTRNTASATLQVIGSAPSTPAHLEIASASGQALKSLDFKADYEGINTTKTIQLKNTGTSGPITWSASSDQSWLLVSPSSGMFNQGQTIDVAVQRSSNLLPKGFPGTKDFSGSLKFFSNVGPPVDIPVAMSVTSLPLNSAVLALSPAVLSLTTVDGSNTRILQTLTMTNPGTKPFNWSVTAMSSTSASTQIAIAHQIGASGNWLGVSPPTSGTVQGLSNEQVQVWVQTASLLPGAYMGTLVFTSSDTLDSTLTLSVSLTVQPHCGLVTTTGFLSFTAVQGKASAGSQAVGLNETASCTGGLNWTAQISVPSWLTVSPASGMLHGTASEFVAVSVNPAGLAPKIYSGFLVFTAPKSTQTVLVQLVVQPPPPPGEPVMGASPLNLNFSYTQGQPGPNGQVVTITNNGGSTLYWNATPIPLACPWLTVSPTGGPVLKGQTGAVTINVNTKCLSPGTYAGQVPLEGKDSAGKQASGSGQVVQVNLVVQPACTLTQPSLSALSFGGVQGEPNPNLQTVLISGTGDCTWPLNITAVVSPNAASWLQVQPTTASIKGNGQSTSLAIGPNSMYKTLSAGSYTAQVTINGTDSAGILAQGNPQSIAVTLTVLPPCTFAPPTPSGLSFTIAQGAAQSTPQDVTLGEMGTCSRPITYTVTDTGSATWLSLSQPAPDSGSGSTLKVNVSATNLQAGPYTDQINITAVDNNGLPVSGTVTIPVTVNVTASISGTVFACTGTPGVCVAPTPLPGATVTVLNGSVTVVTVTADSSGNYVIPTLATGNYTVNVSGTDSLNVQYTATNIPLNVTGNATGVNFNAFSG